MHSSARAEAAPLTISNQPCTVVRFQRQGTVLTWLDVATALHGDNHFRSVWNAAWATPSAYMWKPVPIHPATPRKPFFAVLVPSRFPAPDAADFQAHLDALPPGAHVASFLNLGGTSRLIVPAARGGCDHLAYGHLASFCRTASEAETDAFWVEVARHAHRALEAEATVWCNTHGHGVPWLHVRFDPSHTYAAFPPYGPITAVTQAAWYHDYYAPSFSDRCTDA